MSFVFQERNGNKFSKHYAHESQYVCIWMNIQYLLCSYDITKEYYNESYGQDFFDET